MALNKSLVSLPMEGGLNTKTDPKQQDAGYLSKAENVVYETLKLLKKRYGYDLKNLFDQNGDTISDAQMLSKYGNELLVLTSKNLYAYSATLDAFINRGTLYPSEIKTDVIIRNSNQQTKPSFLYIDNFEIYAWDDSSGGVRYSVVDSQSKNFVVSDQLVDAAGARPRLANINNIVYIFYADGANLKFKSFNVLAASTLSSATTAQTNLSGLFDVKSAQDKMFVAYNSTGDLGIFKVDEEENISSVISFAGQDATNALTIYIDPQFRVFVSWADSTALKYIIYPFTLGTSLISVTTIETIANVRNVTIIQNTNLTYTAYYEIGQTLSSDNYIKKATLTAAGVVSAISVFNRSLGLSSCAFRYNGVNYIVATHDSDLQSTYFVLDENAVVVSKFNNQSGSGLVDYKILNEVYSNSDDSFLLLGQIKGRNSTSNGTFFSVLGISCSELNFAPENMFQNALLAENLHICSGLLSMYDGNTVVEHGMLIFPETLKQLDPIAITIATTTQGQQGFRDIQKITFNAVPTSGTWTIEFDGQTTAALAFNDNAAAVEAAIEALSNVVAATVTGDYTAGFTVQFDDPIANLDLMTLPTNTLSNGSPITHRVYKLEEGQAIIKDVQTISFANVPTTGEFVVSLAGAPSDPINYSQSAAEVKTAIEAITGIVTVTVTGSFASGFTVTFDDPAVNLDQMIVTMNSLAVADNVGEMSDGDYSYAAVYKWTDNNGRDHRSAPTPVVLEVSLTSGTSTQAVHVQIPTLRVTNKENVIIELYRTEDAGTLYYKVTSDETPLENDMTTDSVSFIDTMSDEELISRELLYTTGGVLENISAPACSLVTVYNNRLAVVGDDKTKVFYSKQVEEGKPVEFTDLIYSDVNPIGGDISAIQSMDEKLIIFSKDATQYVVGDGPNNLLQNDNLTKPELIFSDIGALDSNSMIYTPVGLMFKSRKGIYLISKSLTASYVGNRVEAYNDRVITSAQIVGELNQIRFICEESIALVYNYNLDKWAVFTNHGGKSSITIENEYYYLREDGILYKENRESFSDAGSPIKMRIESGWLYLTEVQGFQRVYHAMILGTYKSAHKLRVRVAYNFVEAFPQETIIDVTDFIDATAYGDYSPYGSPSDIAYGGNTDQNLYQIRVDMERQKCQAIKILIEDAQDTVGEGLSLSAITFRTGIKVGENKLPATNKAGVS